MSTPDRQWFTPAQAAAYLGFSRFTLIRWKNRGQLKEYFAPGSTRPRYRKEDLDALMKSREERARDERRSGVPEVSNTSKEPTQTPKPQPAATVPGGVVQPAPAPRPPVLPPQLQPQNRRAFIP